MFEITLLILLAIFIIVVYMGIGITIGLHIIPQSRTDAREFALTVFCWILLPIAYFWLSNSEKKNAESEQ